MEIIETSPKYTRTFAFFLFITIALNSGAQWTEIQPHSSIGGGGELYSLHFLNADTGYVEDQIPQASSNYYKTIDGGITWSLTSISNAKGDIYFINDTLGFVGGDPIQKTIDGGISWSANDSVASGEIIHFIDDSIGYVSSLDTVYKTIDAGSSWTPLANISGFGAVWDMYFINEDVGFLVGRDSGDGRILRTTDGGITWTEQIVGNHSLLSVCFTDSNTGYVVGGGSIVIPSAQDWEGVIYKTTDGGDTWVEQFTDVTGLFLDVVFTAVDTGYVAGFFGTILKTVNGGDDWHVQELPSTTHWITIFFVNKDLGYVTGRNSVMLKTTNGGSPIVTNEDSTPDPGGVYPNPANSTININMEDVIQQVRVFDFNGKAVLEVNGEESESLSIDISELAIGYYNVYIRMENGVFIQRLIKV